MADWSLFGGVCDVKTIGIDTATSARVLVTASASANTKGSYVELSASTPVASTELLVSINAPTVDSLVDIAVGAAGSEQVIAGNLYCGNGAASRVGTHYHIHVAVPAGTRISARSQSTTGSSQPAVSISLLRGGLILPASPGRITPYGANTADSGGVQVDPGGSANTKGGYSEIAASTINAIKGLLLAFGTMASTTRASANWLVDIAVGAAGSEQVVVENFAISCNTAGAKTVLPQSSPLIPLSIPAGVRLSARAQCDITTAGTAGRLFDVIVYGID